jgi:hypothetical protein
METMDYLAGITTSIIGAIVLSSLLFLTNRVIIPLVRGKIIKVPDISGDWEGNEKSSDEKPIISRLTVKQTGIKIKAKLERTHHKRRVFYYRGIFESGQVILTFEEKGGESYNIGSMVLKLSSSKNSLKGKALYFHHNSNEVIATEKYFYRS